eukprot:TRINITY_DN1484_c0_g9_i1.p1 TRINITY_DN1484_c0_g9~~TRINITY_DN1484_c0_g9_i1.p1  ORF type:complete len:304 (+),score=81.93 TRINITY_DN1484_c0_g9_i1:213-1124(+)
MEEKNKGQKDAEMEKTEVDGSLTLSTSSAFAETVAVISPRATTATSTSIPSEKSETTSTPTTPTTTTPTTTTTTTPQSSEKLSPPEEIAQTIPRVASPETQTHRDRVAQEILKTEQLYLKNLSTLVKVFLMPLRAAVSEGNEIITTVEIRKIFSDIEVIININHELLRELEPRIQNWSSTQCLGDVFLNMSKFLKVYTQYVNNYNIALATINECKQNTKFWKFLQECEQNPEIHRTAITSFLIMPVQRIPRYELLLKELLKHTQPTHPDYSDLLKSYNHMKDVANYFEAVSYTHLTLPTICSV